MVPHRKNPFGVDTKKLLVTSGWAVVGGVASRAIPENLLSAYNTGVIGYVLNAAVAFGGAWALHAIGKWGDAAFGFAVGGIVETGGRIVTDVFGKTVVQFSVPAGLPGAAAQPAAAAVPAGTSGLGRFGDPAFNLGRYVKPFNFPLPWWPTRDKALAAPSQAQAGPASPGGQPTVQSQPHKSMRQRLFSRTAGAVM